MKKGLLLINLGTPDAPDTRSVRRYLREFLADPRVINIAAPLRYLLLYGLILPFRSKRSAKAYQLIWSPEGSPLLRNSLNLLKKTQNRLGEETIVSFGMRYGTPSIQDALETLNQCSHVTILPLYPQYSSAATGSSIQNALAHLSRKTTIPSIHIIRDFHNHPAFITALADLIRPYLTNHDYVLFSYHGIPLQHIIDGGCPHACSNTPCPSTTLQDTGCYRAQCFQTTKSIAETLNLTPQQHSASFQSRLGKTPWIKPYTDEVLAQLAQRNIKRLAIACPSFVADCLETLEEIAIRANKQWQALGGEHLTLIPCLNDSDQWVDAILTIARS
jgi:ferrochelatase